MKPTQSSPDAVGVVRVHRHGDGPSCLLIDVLEVGRADRPDRLLGRVTDPAEAGRLLAGWLEEIRGGAVPDR